MKLKVTQVLAEAKAREAKPKPLPKLRVKGPAPTEPEADQVEHVPLSFGEGLGVRSLSPATPLWSEMLILKKERAKLSTRAANLVEEIEAQLRKESPAKAEAFINGEISHPALKQAYNGIQHMSDQIMQLYDRIQHAEQTGTVPQPEAPPNHNIDALKHQLTRLKDNIYKARKKLEGKPPKNPTRIQLWQEEVARLEAEREDVRLRIKRLTHG